MKLIEALKTRKIILKKIERLTSEIQEYSSILDTEKPQFGSEEEQRKEVDKRLQAVNDLISEFMSLTTRIRKTNAETTVMINGTSYSLNDLLDIKTKLGAIGMAAFRALNTVTAERKRQNYRSLEGKTPSAVPMYDEKKKLAGIQKWQSILDEFSIRQEEINNSTELLD